MSYSIFPQKPEDVERVETEHRRIVTPLPNPGTLQILDTLRKYEPRSMGGQPPIVWDRADDIYVYDGCGNKWLDFSSGVLVTNAGHGNPHIRAAISRAAAYGLLFSYCFPNAARSALVEKLATLAPADLDTVFLLSTGAEAVENAIKLARAFGRAQNPSKYWVVSFEGAFHGRTLGAQMVGGIPSLKTWIGGVVEGFVQVPFPDGFRTKDVSFSLFEKSLREQGVSSDKVCAVVTETFQGGGASFAPIEYMHDLAEWCRRNHALLVFDEVQAGFGRTGKFWGFEHYGVVPDIICCGKGISGSLPLSCTISRREIMDIFEPRTMTSTHAGHPVVCEAALANIEFIIKENLVENARAMGEVLHEKLRMLQDKYAHVIGAVHGKGLVAGVHVTRPGSVDPDGALALRVVWEAVKQGLMLFAPVGYGSATIKICPPLTINRSAILDGVEALDSAFAKALKS